jgi:hypothetical protein
MMSLAQRFHPCDDRSFVRPDARPREPAPERGARAEVRTMQRRKRIHSHHGRSACLSLAALGAGFSVGLRDAGAAEPSAGMLPVTGLAGLDSPEPEDARSRPPSWLGENLFYKKHVGFEYRRELKLGGHPFELGLQGPLVRKKKRAGLMMEVRF